MKNINEKFREFDKLSSKVDNSIKEMEEGVRKIEMLIKSYSDLGNEISKTFDNAISEIEALKD